MIQYNTRGVLEVVMKVIQMVRAKMMMMKVVVVLMVVRVQVETVYIAKKVTVEMIEKVTGDRQR